MRKIFSDHSRDQAMMERIPSQMCAIFRFSRSSKLPFHAISTILPVHSLRIEPDPCRLQGACAYLDRAEYFRWVAIQIKR